MKCLIIDDEPAARKILRKYISDTNELALAGECKDALEARKKIKELKVDLLFLDINMPRLSGIEFIKTFSNPPKIIFTTAYSEYALDGYELDAIDYLLKPFSFERFLKAVDKASRAISTAENDSYISVKADGKIYRLSCDDVLYAESQGDYIIIHTDEQRITTYAVLKELYSQLPQNSFARIHRSYVVSLKKIDFVEGNTVKIGKHTLPIGKSYRDDFIKKYMA